ncbi:hypothetical protein IQ06DRAFT_216169 [Phaeosphaeriaceae sp. SRC1lsM3a]|nr:hypothetical protein IQ06DRAFT_216169 [Stagonospora sp. SRC1lsM3a]
MQKPYPTFAELPVDQNGPWGNAWGLWGADDQLGTLNHLTAERVRAAAREEIITGERVSLNWCLEGASNPRFQHPRKRLEVTLLNKEPRVYAFDDEVRLTSKLFVPREGADHVSGLSTPSVAANGMDADIMRIRLRLYYMGRKASDFESSKEPNSIHPIHQGLSLDSMRTGDILVIRSGYLAQYATMTPNKRKELDDFYETTKPCNIGVEAGEEILNFLWEKQLAAVAGDSRSFESWPCPEEKKKWHLHQWLLAGWGMPIGELWDLEALSAICDRLGRWSFFLTSAPMNVPGGVASPSNALAFF